jgi:transcriptional regulator with XRE-family HTH domain
METFGSRLQRLRRERGLSRYAVAKGAGLSHPLMKYLENLTTGAKVQTSTMYKLARFYGLSMEELYSPPAQEEEPHAA